MESSTRTKSEPLASRLNAAYFENALSQEAYEQLLPLDRASPQAVANVDRACRLLRAAGVGPREITATLTWQLGSLMPGMVPDAWGGIVPPITSAGRLRRLDEYVKTNHWHRPAYRAGPVLLDIGCGFPPLTSVDSAAQLEQWSVVGVDPSFGDYLVDDGETGYACFTAMGELRYYQPRFRGVTPWDVMLRDRERTAMRFQSLFARLLPLLPPDDGTHQQAMLGNARVARHPILEFTRANLTFLQHGIGDALALERAANVVRCVNVLMYFDRAFREHASRWVESLLVEDGLFIAGCVSFAATFARYSVYQKSGGRLTPREFAFSVDNIRPTAFMPCYTLREDDMDALQLARAVALLRNDSAFLRRFDAAADAALAEEGLCERGTDGYLYGSAATLAPGVLSEKSALVAQRLRGLGIAELAVEVLRRKGCAATVNCVGDIAVPIIEPPALPHSLVV